MSIGPGTHLDQYVVKQQIGQGAMGTVCYSGSGFSAGDPLFVVLDGAADCSNPTSGVKVFSTAGYADPLLTEPSPSSLPSSPSPPPT